MGVSLGRRAGLAFALISGESGTVLHVIAAKLGIVDVYPSCKDKASALRDFAAKHELELDAVCFIGDDVNDAAALEIAGLAAVPANGHPSALARATLVTTRPGGSGAVREVLDAILANRSSDDQNGNSEGKR